MLANGLMDSSAVKMHMMKKGSSKPTVLIWTCSNPHRLLLTVDRSHMVPNLSKAG